MKNKFKMIALEHAQFESIFEMCDDELKSNGIVKKVVNDSEGYPCRITLEDANIGETILLLNYEHHHVDSPYKASGPIFIRMNAKTRVLGVNEVPLMFYNSLLSLRGYSTEAMLVKAIVVEGKVLADAINKLFENQEIEYIHIHNARPGCYNCMVVRA